MKTRKSWTKYFLDMADVVASRSTCDRKHVGCVLVQGRQVVAAGYNGSAPGSPHCDDVGHDMEDGHCVRTTHAEANAVAQAARSGARIEGAIAYVNTFPCFGCFKLLASAGVCMIVYRDAYREDARVKEAARLAVILIQSEGQVEALSLNSGVTREFVEGVEAKGEIYPTIVQVRSLASKLVEGKIYVYEGKEFVFSHLGQTGLAIIHPKGEPDMQSSLIVPVGELFER